MNVPGATFTAREGGDEDPANSMHFKVLLLPAPASAKELECVHVVTMLRGSPVGQPIVVPARKFFLEYVPVGQVPAPGDGLGTPNPLGTFDVATLFPEFFKSHFFSTGNTLLPTILFRRYTRGPHEGRVSSMF